MSSHANPRHRRTTVTDLRQRKDRGERWAMLTSYDAQTAALFEEAGVSVLLVGDSAANVVFGHETTVPVQLDHLIALAAGVVRGTTRALVVGDLPFGSYEGGPDQALTSAVRYLKEAGVQAVKLEGGADVVPQVRALVSAGIPVMGHVGLTPQRVHALGGLRVQGRGDAGQGVIDAAVALEDAGAFAVVLEAVPVAVAAGITERLTIPTVGIGAGNVTDAQVLVWQDFAGLTPGRVPKFVKPYLDLRTLLSEATERFVADVREGSFPGPDHTYE